MTEFAGKSSYSGRLMALLGRAVTIQVGSHCRRETPCRGEPSNRPSRIPRSGAFEAPTVA